MQSSATSLRQIRTVFAIGLACTLLWLFGTFLMVVFVGVLLAVGLNAPAALLAKHTPVNYSWSLLVVIAALLSVMTAVSWIAIPDMASQADEMRERMPELMDLARQRLEQYQWGRDLLESKPDIADVASSRRLWTGLAGAFSSTFGALANMALILFLGLYLSIEPDLYRRGVLFLAPQRFRGRIRDLLEECASVLRYWLFGTLLSMSIIGLLTFLGLKLLGVSLALSLAMIAALLAFVPNFGPVIAAVPAVLLTLLDSPRQAMYVALLYIGVQTIESYFITPFIRRKTVSLPPALTISAQFLMGILAGGFGLFVATPLAALGLVIVRRLRSPASEV